MISPMSIASLPIGCSFYLIPFERVFLFFMSTVYVVLIIPLSYLYFSKDLLHAAFTVNLVWLFLLWLFVLKHARSRGNRIKEGVIYSISRSCVREQSKNGEILRKMVFTGDIRIRHSGKKFGDVILEKSSSEFLGSSSIFYPFFSIDGGSNPNVFVLCNVENPQDFSHKIKSYLQG